MQDLFNILIIIILIGLPVFYFLLRRDLQQTRQDIDKLILQNKDLDSQKFLDLQNKLLENFNLLKQDTLQHLGLITQKQERFIESTAKIEEIARNIETSNLEMRTLKEILAGPKTRGYLGEVMLKEILKTLPSSFYEEQFQIGLGTVVDYVLKLNDTIIPIDAKFPIQNFQRIFELEEKDKQLAKKELIKKLKDEIEDISKKYILPSKGTIEFALMYLANEGIYYELLSDKDFESVWEFAREKSVFLTSPKNFEFICSSLLLIIRKQEFNHNIHQILANIYQLERDLIELNQQFQKSYNQLRNSFVNLQEFERTLNRFIAHYRDLIKSEEKIKERSLI